MLLCSEIWTLYWDGHVKRKVVDQARLAGVWALLKPEFGRLTPGEIHQDTVDRYEDDRVAGRLGTKPVVPSTVRRELNAMIASWHYAVRLKKLGAHDLPVIDLPAHGEPRERWLDDDEREHLLHTAACRRRGARLSRLERFLHIAIETGARRTSIERLTWGQIDFAGRLIRFDQTQQLRTGRRTKKRKVPAPISDTLVEVLQRAFDERVSEAWVLDEPGAIRTAFELCVAEAGFTDVTCHTMRHTAATLMLRNGADPYHVAGVLGDTVETVLRNYGHHCSKALLQAANLISGRRNAAGFNTG